MAAKNKPGILEKTYQRFAAPIYVLIGLFWIVQLLGGKIFIKSTDDIVGADSSLALKLGVGTLVAIPLAIIVVGLMMYITSSFSGKNHIATERRKINNYNRYGGEKPKKIFSTTPYLVTSIMLAPLILIGHIIFIATVYL